MTAAAPALTDEQIQREVLDELKWDARVQPDEIGLIVRSSSAGSRRPWSATPKPMPRRSRSEWTARRS